MIATLALAMQRAMLATRPAATLPPRKRRSLDRK
jgi:hypothetical protein